MDNENKNPTQAEDDSSMNKEEQNLGEQEAPQEELMSNDDVKKASEEEAPEPPQPSIPETETPAEPPQPEISQAEVPIKEELIDEVEEKEEEKEEEAAKEGEKKPTKKKKKRKLSIVGCAFGLLFLYILTIVLGIFILWLNRDSQVFLGNFGLINDVQLKEFLLVAINWSFFPLALLFLILTIIGVFIMASAKKEQKDKRRRGLRMIIFNVIFLFLVIPTWIFIYNFVFSLEVTGVRIIAEIVTEPEDTSDLEAPVIIDFKSERIRTVMNRQGLDINNYEWDFDGDGSFETQTLEETISHRYGVPGTFRVQVRVHLSDGSTEVYGKEITIARGTFAANPERGSAPLTVKFDADLISQGLQVKTYVWDFDGDNVPDEETTSPIVDYTYTKFGDYAVTLQTFDVNDNQKVFRKTITVTPGEISQLRAVIDYEPEGGTAPLRVQFSAADSKSPNGAIKSYEWSFGDGSAPKEGIQTNHVYEQPGEYEVTLTITDEAGERSKTSDTIVVSTKKAPPTAIMRTLPKFDDRKDLLTGDIPLEVQFDATQSEDKDDNIIDYAWDFDGDGEYDTFGSKATHIYKEAGEYTATLKVTDADEQESETSIKVQIGGKTTTAIIEVDREAGPIPLVVKFDGSQSFTNDGSKIVNYEWDFGDGTAVIKTGAIISHKYEKVGNYKVTLKVFSEKGNIGTINKDIFARVVPLQGCFEPSRSSGKAPLTVSFDATCSTGAIQKWQWSFGDGLTSSNRRPTHTFKSTGDFTVTLEVTDNTNTVSQYTQVISVSN